MYQRASIVENRTKTDSHSQFAVEEREIQKRRCEHESISWEGIKNQRMEAIKLWRLETIKSDLCSQTHSKPIHDWTFHVEWCKMLYSYDGMTYSARSFVLYSWNNTPIALYSALNNKKRLCNALFARHNIILYIYIQYNYVYIYLNNMFFLLARTQYIVLTIVIAE